jgi:hypothetical protein
MTRSADPPFRRTVAGLAGTLATLVTALLLPAAPAHAVLPDDVPVGYWPSICDETDTQHCIADVTVTPEGGEPATVSGLNAWAALAADGTLTWAVDGWATPLTEAQDGEVTLVIRTGVWVPRFTAATAEGLRVTRTEDGDGNHLLTITGRPAAVAWDKSSENAVLCTTGFTCGDDDSMAYAVDSGHRFRGVSRDLDGIEAETVAAVDGAYIASGAQATPDFFAPFDDPDNGPALPLGVLLNPQLDASGDPVRGAVNVFVPPGYFTAQQTTPEEAVETGFDLVSSSTAASISIPTYATVENGGVALDVPDIAYPTSSLDDFHHLTVFRRPSQATPDMTAPGSPEQVVATGEPDGLVVRWAAPESDGGSPVTGYRVRMYPAATGGPVLRRCDAGGPEVTECRIGELTDGDVVWVAPSAVTALGEGRAESRVAVTVGEPVYAPGAPRTLKVVAAANRLTASWLAPLSDGGAAITRYTVRAYRTAVAGTAVKACVAIAPAPATPALSCAITGLTSNERLYLEVSATNRVGVGPVTTTRVSGAPLTVSSAPRSVVVKSAKSRISATWAPPLNTGGTKIIQYRADLYTAAKGGAPLYRCTTTGVGRTCTGAVLKPGRTYYLSVVAVNAVGASAGSARIKVVVKK